MAFCTLLHYFSTVTMSYLSYEFPLFQNSWNHGQACCAGSRIFVHAKIYDEFLRRFTEKSKQIKLGDPFDPDVYQGPQVSKQQYDVS